MTEFSKFYKSFTRLASKMSCKIYTGVPGTQKTISMMRKIVASQGLYLVAFPRTDLIEEQAAWLRAQSTPDITVEAFHSDQKARAPVGRRVAEALRAHREGQHVVLLTTHATMLDLDPVCLQGWHTRIDECPDSAVASDSFSATASWSSLDRLFKLVPIGDGRWWHLALREGVRPPKLNEIIKDAAKDLVPFYKCALSSRAVFVNLGSWEDAKRRKVRWWSIWTPSDVIDNCASLAITGASFFNSLPYLAARWLHEDGITFEEVKVVSSVRRTGRPRVLIHYFTDHLGSTDWWTSDEGSWCIVQISRYLESIRFSGYLSCNEAIRPYFRHRTPGMMVEPRLAGTNSLIEHASCAYFYSNKAQDADSAILEVLGLNRDHIKASRETEDMIQFVFRGMIRRPDFNGTYHVYLYSRDQAEALRTYLVSNGLTADVEMVALEDAGIMEIARPDQSAGVNAETSVTEEDRRKAATKANTERKKLSRARKKQEMEEAGTYRGPGRPRKVIDKGAEVRT